MRARAAVPGWPTGRRPPALDLRGPAAGETVARIGRAMHIAASSSSKAIVSLFAVA
jgi:hypothetical protein